MNDSIIKIGNSLIQHGKQNDRIYLMKLYKGDEQKVISLINELIHLHNYSKIFAKIPYEFKKLFNESYKIEAIIPNFYNGKEDALFLGKYIKKEREYLKNEKIITNIIETSKSKAIIANKELNLAENFYFKKCSFDDTEKMTELYKQVFESYPFPIHKNSYIQETMMQNVDYYGIFNKDNKIVALSSSEKDLNGQNSEMTDFATLPEYRGLNFSLYLLKKMEEDAKKQGIKTVYTIARAVSYGMNISFSKMGYNYSGTLKNNTYICNEIESMNVWYKSLT